MKSFSSQFWDLKLCARLYTNVSHLGFSSQFWDLKKLRLSATLSRHCVLIPNSGI